MEKTFLEMLTYRRPMGSDTEQVFCDKFIAPLPGCYRDDFGNYHVVIGNARILWSAHTDTVHRVEGRQTVHVGSDRFVSLSRKSITRGSNCLGADCTTGVYLLTEMIKAGIAGRYVFHYGEERGAHGSSDLAKHHGKWLAKSFDHAIAFDRHGITDVITHQGWSRTASDSFATAFAERIGIALLCPCDQGIFTDTANYAEIIPECTNVSVGYYHEHTREETQDLDYLRLLRDRLCQINTLDMPIDRDPSDDDDDDDRWPVSRWTLKNGYWTKEETVTPTKETKETDANGYLSREYYEVQRALSDVPAFDTYDDDGRPINHDMQCEICGRFNLDDADVCDRCGEDLRIYKWRD